MTHRQLQKKELLSQQSLAFFIDQPTITERRKITVGNHWRRLFSDDLTVTDLRNLTELTVNRRKLFVMSRLLQKKEILSSDSRLSDSEKHLKRYGGKEVVWFVLL